MTCPKCNGRADVLKTEPNRDGSTARLRRCETHGRFWTRAFERLSRWIDSKDPLPATDESDRKPTKRRQKADKTPLAGNSDLSPSVNSSPQRSDLETSQQVDRVEEKPNPHAGMVAEFDRQWREIYGERYSFAGKDVSNLKRFITEQPHLIDRWPEMVSRYLGDGWWGDQRHPLWGLATTFIKFSGEKVVTGNGKTSGNISTLHDWSPSGRKTA